MWAANSRDIAAVDLGTPQEYWRETLRPFCNLVFLLPFLIVYETGAWYLEGFRGSAMRNGADAWMRLWLGQAGADLIWLPPMILMGTLLAWHWFAGQPWKLKWDTLGGMAAECLLYAFILILLGQLTDLGFRQTGWVRLELTDHAVPYGAVLRAVTFMGAGIYEEFLFRLCLLSAIYLSLRVVLTPKYLAVVGTVIATSLIFSLAHYLSPRDDGQLLAIMTDAATRVVSKRELWFGFAFRTLAGVFFAALCLVRGFGITVGTHAVYDIFVGLVLTSEI